MTKLHTSLTFNVLLCLIFVIRCTSSQHVCFRKISGGIEPFCCDNYVRRNGLCVECEAGTKSKNEETCIPCNHGTYGSKCSRLCKCKLNERCDRVIGCVLGDVFSTSNLRPSTVKTYSGETEFVSHTASDLQESRTSINTITVAAVIKEHFTKTEIVVYSVGSSSIILIIAIVCFVFFWIYKHKRQNIGKSHFSRQDNQATNETFYIDVEGSLYDSINEDEIYDDNIQIIYFKESTEVDNKITSDSEGSAVESDCSGYLHPYSTVTKDFETHTYCKQIKSYDSSSLHSVIDYTDIDSGYTHPYEQLEVVNTAEVKSDYAELVHYFELIDITKPASMSKVLSNNSLIPNSNDNEQTENDMAALSPLLNKTIFPYIFNRNIIPPHQSLNCKFNRTTHFSSLPTFDQREEKEKLPNFKHISV